MNIPMLSHCYTSDIINSLPLVSLLKPDRAIEVAMQLLEEDIYLTDDEQLVLESMIQFGDYDD